MGGREGAFCLSPQGGCKASVATALRKGIFHTLPCPEQPLPGAFARLSRSYVVLHIEVSTWFELMAQICLFIY